MLPILKPLEHERQEVRDLLDVGCGFPPQTSMDASKSFPDWQIIGADPAFDEYVLYDEDGHYACLNARGQVRYFQPGRGTPVSWMALFDNLKDNLKGQAK